MISKILSNTTLFIPLFFIFLFLFVAIFSYQIMPDDTPMANSIELSIAKKKPGFQGQYLLFKKENNKAFLIMLGKEILVMALEII